MELMDALFLCLMIFLYHFHYSIFLYVLYYIVIFFLFTNIYTLVTQ